MTRPVSSLTPASYAHCWVGTWSLLLTCWLGASQGLVPVGGGPAVVLRIARPVGHERARVRERGSGVDGRQPMVQGEVGDPCSQAEEERAPEHDHRVGAVPTGRLEGVVEIVG